MNSRKITVMFLINYLEVGGAEQQLLELVKGIDKSRFKPLVVSLYPGGSIEKEIKQIPHAELISVNRKGKYDFGILLKMLYILWQKKVDIIHPFSTPAAFFGLLPALLNPKIIKIMSERGGFRSATDFGFRLYQKTEDYITRFIDLVVANSEAGRSYLVSRGVNPDRIEVIYNGINFERLTPDQTKVEQIKDQIKLPVNGKIIGMVANFFPDKDYTTFLHGARIIHDIIPQTRFIILGDGPQRSNIENMASELGLGTCVAFLGYHRDIASYISCFDVACLCADRSEGCSNVILESMALGKPVVATDGGGNREVVGDGSTGFLVPMQDHEAFAGAVLTCLNQPDRARDMGQRARKIVLDRFSLARMVGSYELLYEQTIKARQEKTGIAKHKSKILQIP